MTGPAVPRCEVADQIIPWDEVLEGDLVLWDGEMCLVTLNALILEIPGARILLLDGGTSGVIPCGTYAAVRRYVTDEPERTPAPAGEKQ